MSDLVILHNSVDKPSVQLLASMAAADILDTKHKVWIDQPLPRDTGIDTITGDAPLDEKIAEAIANARAVLYVVGNYGEGRYQKAEESKLVREAVEKRAGTETPLNLIPVLLHDGRMDDIPKWMRRYIVVNHNHEERGIPGIWQLVKFRLITPIDPLEEDEVAPEPPAENRLIERLVSAMQLPKQMTIFLGPYSSQVDAGPASTTRHFAKSAGIPDEEVAYIWPSEAIQWAQVPRDRDEIDAEWERFQTSAGFNPDDLAKNVGELAERWRKVFGKSANQGAGWEGLIILTTNTDLALENVFTKIQRFEFTRIIPTLQNVNPEALRAKSIQQWGVDGEWEALPNRPSNQHVDIGTTEPDQFKDRPMDDVSKVVLVKLCGTVDIRKSLVLSAEDIYRHSQTYQTLPPQLELAIRSSARLVLGQGFCSPLAQMLRQRVLSYSDPERIRLWVVPPANDSAEPEEVEGVEDPEQAAPEDPAGKRTNSWDELCGHELDLVEKHENKLLRQLGLTDILRSSEADFVRLLANRL